MTGLDLDFVRAQFPAFSEPSLKGFAHFENAGGSYACRHTIEWLDRFGAVLFSDKRSAAG